MSTETVRIIVHKGKEILVIDYSGLRGTKMIEHFERARSLVADEQRPFPILNIFDDNTFVSSDFMRHVEKNVPELDSLISKQAIIGISFVQGWILKGMNLWAKTKIQQFKTFEEAVDYLVTGE